MFDCCAYTIRCLSCKKANESIQCQPCIIHRIICSLTCHAYVRVPYVHAWQKKRHLSTQHARPERRSPANCIQYTVCDDEGTRYKNGGSYIRIRTQQTLRLTPTHTHTHTHTNAKTNAIHTHMQIHPRTHTRSLFPPNPPPTPHPINKKSGRPQH